MNDQQTQPAEREARSAPCSASCAKCGCDDIYRRFYDAGKDTNGPSPKCDRKSTEWVDRSDAWVHPAIKDCIVHVCRCCGYQWDSDPLPKSSSAWLGAWVECKERLPQSGRVLVFSPLYAVGDPTRFRVMDAQFVRISTDCTHWMDLDAIAPNI